MNLLVITRAPWLNDNGIGNTLTDFFSDFKDYNIYGLCLREAPTVTNLCKNNYFMSEGQIIKALRHKGTVGCRTVLGAIDTTNQKKEEIIYNNAKYYNFTLLKFAREAIWGTGLWKNNNLNTYLYEVAPDVIFFPDFPCVYAHKVLKYIKEKTGAKIVIYHADDCYTLKQFSLSPLFWIYRFYQRKWVKNSVKLSDLHYVISDVQKTDYDKAFGVEHKVLTKFADFSGKPQLKERYNHPLQLVYTGNIGLNRWKSLAKISKALKLLNRQECIAQLRIYTANKITSKIKKALMISDTSFIMGKASSNEIQRIQNEADILVHVESCGLKNRLLVRQSFSTKIVDYLKQGRAILVFGPKNVASIKHLVDNDCAIVDDTLEGLVEDIKHIFNNHCLLNDYAEKAYMCGKKYHNRDDMLKMLRLDIENL